MVMQSSTTKKRRRQPTHLLRTEGPPHTREEAGVLLSIVHDFTHPDDALDPWEPGETVNLVHVQPKDGAWDVTWRELVGRYGQTVMDTPALVRVIEKLMDDLDGKCPYPDP